MFEFFIYFLLAFAILYVGCLVFLYFTQKFNPKVFDDIINCKWDRD
jgi:hypothetical protein